MRVHKPTHVGKLRSPPRVEAACPHRQHHTTTPWASTDQCARPSRPLHKAAEAADSGADGTDTHRPLSRVDAGRPAWSTAARRPSHPIAPPAANPPQRASSSACYPFTKRARATDQGSSSASALLARASPSVHRQCARPRPEHAQHAHPHRRRALLPYARHFPTPLQRRALANGKGPPTDAHHGRRREPGSGSPAPGSGSQRLDTGGRELCRLPAYQSLPPLPPAGATETFGMPLIEMRTSLDIWEARMAL